MFDPVGCRRFRKQEDAKIIYVRQSDRLEEKLVKRFLGEEE